MQPVSRRRLVVALVIAAVVATSAAALAQLAQGPTRRPRIWVGGYAVGVNTVLYSLTH